MTPLRALRYFLLGPLIVAMAFTLPSWFKWVQLVVGLLYTSLGLLAIDVWRMEKGKPSMFGRQP